MASFPYICYPFAIRSKLYLKIVDFNAIAFKNVMIRIFKKRMETSICKRPFFLPVTFIIPEILVLSCFVNFFHCSLLRRPMLIQATVLEEYKIQATNGRVFLILFTTTNNFINIQKIAVQLDSEFTFRLPSVRH